MTLLMLLYSSPSYSLETRSLTEPGAGVVAQSPIGPSVFGSHSACVISIHCCVSLSHVGAEDLNPVTHAFETNTY